MSASPRHRFADFAPVRRFQPALALSPDGNTVVYASNASGQSNLWRHEIGAGLPTQLTHFTEHAVRDIAWSPDGTLAFTADHHGDEFHQVFLIDPAGGEPRQLTATPDVQHHLATSETFSPDGRLLVYAANDRERTCQDVLVHNLETGGTERVIAADGLHHGVGISPDGTMLAAVRLNSNTDADVLVVDLLEPDSANPRDISSHEGEVKHEPGPWKPDGSGVYVLTDRGRDFVGIAEFTVPPDGGEPVMSWYETPEWDVEQVAMSADGRALAWTVNENGYSRLYVRDLSSGTDVAVPALPGGVIGVLRMSRGGDRLAFLLATPTRPAEVVTIDLRAGTVDILTDSVPPALAEVTPVAPVPVDYRSHDGRRVPAFLCRPHGGGRFPVLLSIHGGPEAQERPTYLYAGFYQCLLANGIGVLAPNVRGSTGYGSAYQKLIHHDWGGAELGDFEQAVHYLRGLDWVDPDRIAVFGGSFGGFATLSCVSRLPDLWAAAVDIVGPANLITFVKSVPPTWQRLMDRWVGNPETERDFLLARSPITYADDIVAPLFVIQGANDPRVARAESDQIVERLRVRGVDVRYDVYDDEGHGFTKRDNEIKALGDASEFLITHLAGQS